MAGPNEELIEMMKVRMMRLMKATSRSKLVVATTPDEPRFQGEPIYIIRGSKEVLALLEEHCAMVECRHNEVSPLQAYGTKLDKRR